MTEVGAATASARVYVGRPYERTNCKADLT